MGVTGNIERRLWQHRDRVIEGFTARYRLRLLVYYEVHDTFESAFRREKSLKHWRRTWKIALIEAHNPVWEDVLHHPPALAPHLR